MLYHGASRHAQSVRKSHEFDEHAMLVLARLLIACFEKYIDLLSAGHERDWPPFKVVFCYVR